jgi:hypothetical protein
MDVSGLYLAGDNDAGIAADTQAFVDELLVGSVLSENLVLWCACTETSFIVILFCAAPHAHTLLHLLFCFCYSQFLILTTHHRLSLHRKTVTETTACERGMDA